ncbi:MAG: hypothetical protein ABJG78_18815 [Cyclobacteriaceae bacterium]
MKKVLVISYYWPPAGGISVLRTLKIVKYLRDFGWEPVVFVPSNAHYPYLDPENEKDVPEDLIVLKHPILEPFKLFKFLSRRKKDQPLNSIVQVRDRKPSAVDKLGIWIRGNFFIPDARSLWIKPSVKFLVNYLEHNPVDAIFSDGPPHTNTYIANLVKKRVDVPWLSDFQDPWTQVDYYKMLSIGNRAHRKHSKMEQECFENASKITIASPSWKTDLEGIGAQNVDVIYYGYDEDDFKNLQKEDSDYFDIVHIGLLGIDRHPQELIKILREINFTKPIRLLLAGQIDVSIEQELSELKSNVAIEILGTISRKKALQLAFNADLLLLPLNKAENANGRLPGKLYEYLRTYNPILALGPLESDAARILTDTKSGICLEYSEEEKQKDFLEKLIQGSIVFEADTVKVKEFSNFAQTKKIATYLDQIV